MEAYFGFKGPQWKLILELRVHGTICKAVETTYFVCVWLKGAPPISMVQTNLTRAAPGEGAPWRPAKVRWARFWCPRELGKMPVVPADLKGGVKTPGTPMAVPADRKGG